MVVPRVDYFDYSFSSVKLYDFRKRMGLIKGRCEIWIKVVITWGIDIKCRHTCTYKVHTAYNPHNPTDTNNFSPFYSSSSSFYQAMQEYYPDHYLLPLPYSLAVLDSTQHYPVFYPLRIHF